MNVREQGPGGLLMLFASGAVFVHLGEVHPRLLGTAHHWSFVLALFVAALMFLALGLLKMQSWRNGVGFALGAALLFGLLGLYARHIGHEELRVPNSPGTVAWQTSFSKYDNPRLAEDYAAARRLFSGVNPYAGAAKDAPAGGNGGDDFGDLGGDDLGDLGGDSSGPGSGDGSGDGSGSGSGSGSDVQKPKAPTDDPVEVAKYSGGSVSGYYRRPAGAFLLYAPLAAFDVDQRIDPRYVMMILLVITCLVLGQALGRNFFFLPMLLALALPIYLAEVLAGNTSFAWVCFTCLAWTVAPQRWLSGLFLGLACSVDTMAWFVAPFLVGITTRETDGKTGGLQLLVILGVFLAVNGYWAYDGFGDWSQAISDGLFAVVPAGADGAMIAERSRDSIGLAMLEDAGVVGTLDAKSTGPYMLLVCFLTLLALILYLLFPIALYALGPVLGVLPFWAFFRSDLSLFYAIPLLAISGWASARLHPPHERYVEPDGGLHRY